MYKKLIFAALTIFCSINLISREETFNDKKERLNYLFSIEKEINNTLLSEKEKQEVKAIIQNYSYTNQSHEDYMFTLQELKKSLEEIKKSKSNSFIAKIINSSCITLGCYLISKYLIISNLKPVDKDIIENAKKINSLLKDHEAEIVALKEYFKSSSLDYSNKEELYEKSKNSIKKLFELLDLIKISNIDKLTCPESFLNIEQSIDNIKSSSEEYLKNLQEDIHNNSNSYYLTTKGNRLSIFNRIASFNANIEYNIKNCIDNNRRIFNKNIAIPTVIGLLAFLFSHQVDYIAQFEINSLEKLLNQAIQEAEQKN